MPKQDYKADFPKRWIIVRLYGKERIEGIMNRKLFCIFVALIFLLASLPLGCSGNRPTDMPSAEPTSSLLPTVTPTPTEEKPIGGYELDDSGDVLTVFLSTEQGAWTIESFDSAVIDVKSKAHLAALHCFRLHPSRAVLVHCS